jgi:hypothetical protein
MVRHEAMVEKQSLSIRMQDARTTDTRMQRLVGIEGVDSLPLDQVWLLQRPVYTATWAVAANPASRGARLDSK